MNLFSLCASLKERIHSCHYLEHTRKHETDFTRNRKMPFCDIIQFVISAAKTNVQTALDVYFTQKGADGVSRQAFAKARENIKHEAFIELNELVIQQFETEETEIHTYRGYRLFSADGTIIDLPNTPALREHFGFSSNGTGRSFAKALGITAFDVLNKLTVFAELYRYDDSEKRRILDIVDGFAQLQYPKSIWLLDRGYPSFELFERLVRNGQHFVIRVSTNALKEINAVQQEDQTIHVTRHKSTLNLRVIQIRLANGATEKLVTNLSDSFSSEELQELYSKRWGIETHYRFLKHKSVLEVFTGESITAVMQDFHAAILLLNLAAVAEQEQDAVLQKGNAQRQLKHQYHPSKSKIIADLKMNFVELILAKTNLSRTFRWFFAYRRIRKFAYSALPDRHFDRNFARALSRRSAHPKLP